MLDLGIYVFQIGSNILKALNYKIEDFDKSNSKIWMKNTQKDKIDFEVTASLKYGQGDNSNNVELTSNMNPGGDHLEEIDIRLKNGDKIT